MNDLSSLIAEQWQPIETAPKNTKVLASYQNELGNWRIVTACYHTQLEWSDEYGDHEEEYAPEGWYEENDSSDVIYPTSRKPTHWMPLPSPPRARTEAAMSDVIPADIMDAARTVAMKIAAVLPISGSEDVNHIARAIFAERQRIVARLKEEADFTLCAEDAMVTRSNARLIEADFSYEEAERLMEIEEATNDPTGGDHG